MYLYYFVVKGHFLNDYLSYSVKCYDAVIIKTVITYSVVYVRLRKRVIVTFDGERSRCIVHDVILTQMHYVHRVSVTVVWWTVLQ